MNASVSMKQQDGLAPPGEGGPSPQGVPGLVPAVSRALSVLDLLAQAREPMGVARLAARLRLPKSSVHGLCNTMALRGYLRRCADGSYFIGPSVMALSQAFLTRTNVAQEFAAVFAQDAVTPPDETVVLSVLAGAEVVYVAARNGTRPLGLAFNVGMRLPSHLAATGKAMLAHQDDAELRRLLPHEELARLTAGGTASRSQLLQELAATRARGYSIDDEGVREGVYGLAAPVFDAAGQAVAGVGVCIHKASLVSADGGGVERYRDAVLRVALELTHRLGGRAPLKPQEHAA